MDENNINQNTSEQEPEQNRRQEPTTPFQTPVRGSSPAGSQHYTNRQNGEQQERPDMDETQPLGRDSEPTERIPKQEPQGNPYAQNGAPQGNPYAQSGSQSNSNPNSNPYSNWNAANGAGGDSFRQSRNEPPKRPQRPERPKKTDPGKPLGNGVKMLIAGVAVAVVCFAGGVLVASSLTGGNSQAAQAPAAQAQTQAQTTDTVPQDSTKVEISDSKTTGNGESADDGKTGKQIYEEVSGSVVGVVVDDIRLGAEASGSGVVMSEDGYIITNQHVVSGGNKFTVVLKDSTQYQAELVGQDEQTDLAVLKIEAKEKLTPAEFGKSDELSVGDRCYAIGSPGGIEYQNTFTGGFVSAINRDVTINGRIMTLIQTDAAINPGSSGGALINKYGQVVGITSSKLSASSAAGASFEGMGFAIPMSTAEEIVNKLIAYGKVTGRPAIGISGYDIEKNTAQYYDVPQGVLISSIDAASDAYNEGLQANDIITEVNGKEITSMSDINKIKEKFSAGDTLKIKVYRSGKYLEFDVKLIDEADLSSNNTSSTDTEEEQSGNGYGYGSGSRGGYSYGYGFDPFEGFGW